MVSCIPLAGWAYKERIVQAYVDTDREDPVQHMARYEIRYTVVDPATSTALPSTPRHGAAKRRRASDVPCIDLTGDASDDSAPSRPSKNDTMLQPPSTTVRCKRLSAGHSTPTSTKRARPLKLKPPSLRSYEGGARIPGQLPTCWPGFPPISGKLHFTDVAWNQGCN